MTAGGRDIPPELLARAKRLEASDELGARRILLGVSPAAMLGGFVVWVSVFGRDVNGLTGWRTAAGAHEAFERYSRAAVHGYEALSAAFEFDLEAQPAGFLPFRGGRFTAAEIVGIARDMRSLLEEVRRGRAP